MKKYEEIAGILRREINDRKYEQGSRFPSETDLADRFGMNAKTINKAVSILTLEGLLERRSRGSGTHVKAYSVFPQTRIAYVGILNAYYTEILNGIQQAALEENCMTAVINPRPEHYSNVVEKLKNSDIKGIICNPSGPIDDDRMPVLYLDDESGGDYYGNYVTCDSYQGGYEMMKSLLERGHRNIVILGYAADTKQRLDGFLDAMREAGIVNPEKRVYTSIELSGYDSEVIYREMKNDFPGFTAVAATSDNTIFNLIKLLEKQKIEWRGKIAMTGFGNVSGISDLLPIATVDQHPYHIGVRAFQALMRKIAEPELEIREKIPIELVGLEHIPVIGK